MDERELERWGRVVGAAALEAGAFVCLYGGLGAGKSTLARAACRGAGVSGPVPSPTFTLVNQYVGRNGATVRHADLYRIEDQAELPDMGWADLVQSADVVFVEWADRAAGYLPEDRWDIRLEFAAVSDRRQVIATTRGSAPPMPELPGAREDVPC